MSAKPRIEYVAPKPRLKKKIEEVEPNIGDCLYRVDIYTGDKVNAGTSGEVNAIMMWLNHLVQWRCFCRQMYTDFDALEINITDEFFDPNTEKVWLTCINA